MPTCPTCRMACDDGVETCPVDGTPLGDPLLGRVLGDRYRIVARIGEGGMGTVYRAEHVLLRKRVAVKVLRPELSTDEELVRRFQQEAMAASQIGQENIVDVTDFGRTAQGALYFVMEELPGQSLGALVRSHGPLPLERAVPILAQVCRALAAAHGRGIVHRDLKPDNVILTRRDDGTDFVKVVDFGISKAGSGREPGRLTRAGTIIGTPEYMAPEQGAAATVDHRADVYAFGVLAYELVTGTLPFQGETAIATLLEHQTKAPEPPSRRRPGLSPELEALILKALAKRPAARQQTMAEVASELTRVLAGLGMPPVYERAPPPPPAQPPFAGFTERFAASERPRVSTGRGGTVALDPPVEPEPAAPIRTVEPVREGGRRLATAAVVVALLVAAAVIATTTSTSIPTRTSTLTLPPTTTSTPTRTLPPTPTSTSTTTSSTVPASPSQSRDPAPGRDERGQGSASSSSSPTPPDPALHARPPRAAPRPQAPGSRLGDGRGSGENPYRKLDDLKPDPF